MSQMSQFSFHYPKDNGKQRGANEGRFIQPPFLYLLCFQCCQHYFWSKIKNAFTFLTSRPIRNDLWPHATSFPGTQGMRF